MTAADLTFRALEYRFRVRTEHAPLQAWLDSAFGPLRDLNDLPSARDIESVQLQRSSDGWDASAPHRVFTATRADVLVPRLLVHVNQRVTESAAGIHLVLHAAVLSHGRHLVLLVAPPGSGKSTLAAHAATSGWRYGGDEHAAIHLEDGRITPVPKPLMLKPGSAEVFRQRREPAAELAPFFARNLALGAEDLGAEIEMHRRVPDLIAFVRFDQGATKVTVADVPPARALMMLRAEAFNFGDAAEPAFEVLTRTVRTTPALSLTHHHAPSALDHLVQHFA